MTEFAKRLAFTVTYEGQNITKDISDSLLSLTYTDNVTGKADELEIHLDDSEKKWRNEWSPKKKDTITASIGFPGQMIECGTFQVDEKEIDGPPSTIKIRAIGTGITKKMRTKKSKASEGKTLKQIAKSICDLHDLTLDIGQHVEIAKDIILEDIDRINSIRMKLFETEKLETTEEQVESLISIGPFVGELKNSLISKGFTKEAAWVVDGWKFVSIHYSLPGVRYYINRLLQVENLLHARRFEFRGTQKKIVDNNLEMVITRSTQNNETDLAYLSRIAAEYGFAFKINGKHMVFYMLLSVEGREPSITLNESQLIKYNFKDKISATFASAVVSSHNPKKNKVITATVDAHATPLFPAQSSSPSNDVIVFSDLTVNGFRKSDFNSGVLKEQYSEDVLHIKSKTETKQQAEVKAKMALHTANSNACSGSFETELNIYCCAGNNVEITEVGEYSGIYHITSASFTINKGSGGTVSCEVKRVGFVDQKKKKKSAA